jgi:hypothetical protein
MGLKIVCAGYLVRNPLGGHVWHHLQYLIGLERLGHHVTYFEHYGMPNLCYDPVRDDWTSDPVYGIGFMLDLFKPYRFHERWCYIGEDETCSGMSRAELARACRECDVFLNLSNINYIPEVELCRRRVLIDTDPVFTQIGAHGLGGAFESYDTRFTYGENVHQPGCDMPTAGQEWLPTRQPVVLDLWNSATNAPAGPYTTVMNWAAFGESTYEGRLYGNKARQFEPFFTLPAACGENMELAVEVPPDIRTRLEAGGWVLRDPRQVTKSPSTYQQYLQRSKAEFSVAKHAYVSTHCGWFSDRSAAYIASGRPVVVEDTGFSRWMQTGLGVVAFRTRDEALRAIADVNARYSEHSRAARQIAETYFDSNRVLGDILEQTFTRAEHPNADWRPA